MEVRCQGDGKAWGTVKYWGVNSANVWDQNNMLQMERHLKLERNRACRNTPS